jgi:hypothetical protein
MAYIVRPSEYAKLLLVCEAHKQPLFIKGGPGIGKSAIPRQALRILAKERNLEFVEWSDLTLDQKKNCIAHPEKYYAFMDARTSQMDTTSLQGIPNMTKADLLENIPYSWVVYFTQDKANGAIFFDEINLAAPIVQSITYSAIHDRVISDRRLSPNIFVFAAGNRQKDQAHVFDMPTPLRDRFAEVEIECNAEDWLNWAMKNGINPHLIAFINWKNSYLYKIDDNRNLKPSTPRGVHRASTLIGQLEISSDEVHMLVSISCGEAFATEFQAYTTCYKQVDWKYLLAHPNSVGKLDLGQQYAISAGLAERFQREPKNTELLDKLFGVAECMRQDFSLNTFRMMRDFDKNNFGEGLRKLKKGALFADKYGKFMIDVDCSV